MITFENRNNIRKKRRKITYKNKKEKEREEKTKREEKIRTIKRVKKTKEEKEGGGEEKENGRLKYRLPEPWIRHKENRR